MRTTKQRHPHWELAKLGFFLAITLGSLCVFIMTPNLLPSSLISVLMFFVLSPFIDGAERKGVSRVTAILGVFAVCGIGLAVAAGTIMPRITSELAAFQQGTAHYNFTEKLHGLESRVLANYPFLKHAGVTDKLISWLQSSNDKIWAFVPNLASHTFMLMLLVPFLTFVLLKDAHEIKRQLLRLVPNRQFETVYGLTSRIMDEMGGFVAARGIEASILTALVMLPCLALQIPYAVLLGVFAGATNPIPYLGPLLGAAPAILLAILDPTVPNQLLWIVLIYGIANVIDAAVIFPVIVARIVNLHPVVVVISVVLGSQIFGIVGMIVAVPLTSILKILFQEVYSRVYENTEPLF